MPLRYVCFWPICHLAFLGRTTKGRNSSCPVLAPSATAGGDAAPPLGQQRCAVTTTQPNAQIMLGGGRAEIPDAATRRVPDAVMACTVRLIHQSLGAKAVFLRGDERDDPRARAAARMLDDDTGAAGASWHLGRPAGSSSWSGGRQWPAVGRARSVEMYSKS